MPVDARPTASFIAAEGTLLPPQEAKVPSPTHVPGRGRVPEAQVKVTNARQIHDAELLILDRLRAPLRHLAESTQLSHCDQARILFFALHKARLLSVARCAVESYWGDDAKPRVVRGDEGNAVYRTVVLRASQALHATTCGCS
jgi:hypothetical protein